MQTKFGKLFDATELNELRKKFKYVDAQANGKKRVFFDNAGGSLRLIDAEKRFHAIDLHPDASEHLNTLALELLDIERHPHSVQRQAWRYRYRLYSFPADDGSCTHSQ